MHNYVTFFRFSDMYEDVFIEDDHYLYAIAEPFGWPYLMCVREYRKLDDGWLVSDCAGADCEYLEKLTPAPENIAREIIKDEALRNIGPLDFEEFNPSWWHAEDFDFSYQITKPNVYEDFIAVAYDEYGEDWGVKHCSTLNEAEEYLNQCHKEQMEELYFDPLPF